MTRYGGAHKDASTSIRRPRAEELRERNLALGKEAAQLSEFLRAAPIGIALLDRQLRIVRVNRAMARITGGRAEPGPAISTLSPQLAHELETLCRNVLRTRKAVTEHQICTPDVPTSQRPHCWLATVYPITGPTPGLALILTEWTHSATDESPEARQLETVGRLAGGVAHDFNNLLVGIMGGASLALDALPESHPARKNLELVLRSSDRAAELTRQLLAYSGKGRFFKSRVNVATVVHDTCASIRQRISRSVKLLIETEPRLPVLLADCEQIEEVVRALVVNAAEAIGRKRGTIRVRVKVERKEPHKSCQSCEPRPGKYILLEVSDTGCGMDEHTLNRIFEPFFTTKFTGRGLSLAAVHGVVRALHGFIEVSSSRGRGSRFRVYLRADGHSAPPDGGHAPPAAAH